MTVGSEFSSYIPDTSGFIKYRKVTTNYIPYLQVFYRLITNFQTSAARTS